MGACKEASYLIFYLLLLALLNYTLGKFHSRDLEDIRRFFLYSFWFVCVIFV